ncbi:MAG TPA: 30S ribosomal protein S20 [Nevskiaceae bacterium]|nr:30S ribosomal protein S20 [Nevskiaceae bacterium]
MANTIQARKRVRQSEKHRAANTAQRSMLRTAIRKVVKAVDAKDAAAAEAAYKEMAPLLDRFANRGLIHKRKAARHKSRLTARIRALSAPAASAA